MLNDFAELQKRQKLARDTAYETLRRYAELKVYGEGYAISDQEARLALALLEMQDYHGWLKIAPTEED